VNPSKGAKRRERCGITAETFDYAVVGGGTGGCVLAARLSEDPRRIVLPLGPGGEPTDFRIPMLAAPALS
jgi:choline dehydrogenase-like flavoprotein